MQRFTWRIGTVAGIPIYIHWSFWLLIVWVILGSVVGSVFSWAYLFWWLALIGGLVVSVILHELGHALAARAFDIPTRDITMYPFGGVASLARIPEKPLQELIVALAGPLVNFLLIGIFFTLLALTGASLFFSVKALTYAEGSLLSLHSWLYLLSAMNGVLALFNLLPAFPMDGGRVLRALLALRLPYMQATQIAAFVGQAFAILFFLVGLYGNPGLILIGFFVFVAASQEKRQVEERTAMHGYTVKDALMREVPTLQATQTLREAVDALLGSQARSFLIVDPLQNPVGSLSREQIIEALNEGRGTNTPLTHVMDEDLLIVPPDLPLHEGFRLLQEEHKPFLVVKEGERVLGIVDAENIAEFLLVKHALASAGAAFMAILAKHLAKEDSKPQSSSE